MLSTNRVRHEVKFRKLEVVEVRDLSPGMKSVVLAGPDLEGFTSLGFDDHLKLLLGDPASPIMRDFTPRAFDGKQLTLEFAMHAQGVASDWARGAKPGDRIAIGGPRGSLVVPLAYDWHLLAGDESALPAIARRLEELPEGARVRVIVETQHAAEERALASKAAVSITWLRAGEDVLAEAVRRFEKPSGEGYAWAAGEAASMKRVRAVFREVHGIESSHSRVSAYWKRGAVAHHEDIA